jgi:hypothetical protein
VKPVIPVSLRKWEERAAALKVADALLRADRRRQRAAATPRPDKKAAPVKTKREDGPFAALRNHPLYRAPRTGAGTA